MSTTVELDQPTAVPISGLVVATTAFYGLTAWAGETTLVLALAVSLGVLAWGWAGALGLPTPRGTVAVLVVAGLSILLSVYVPEQGNQMSLLPGALAVSTMAAFLHQLLRRDGRPRVAESVSSVVFALAVFTCSAFFVPLVSTVAGVYFMVAALGAVAASVLVSVVLRRLPEAFAPWMIPAMMVVGGVVGGATGTVSEVPWAAFVVVGVLASGLSHAVRHAFSLLPTMTHARPRAVVALTSVLIVGIVPYSAAQVFYPGAL